MDKQKVETCPFCEHGRLEICVPNGNRYKYNYLLCMRCGARGPKMAFEATAVEKWNHRPHVERLEKRLVKLRNWLKTCEGCPSCNAQDCDECFLFSGLDIEEDCKHTLDPVEGKNAK